MTNKIGLAALITSLLLPFSVLFAESTSCIFEAGARRAGSCVSPDGRYTIQYRLGDDKTAQSRHVLSISRVDTRTQRQLYVFDRTVAVLWSPDSQYLAINDFAGSDYTNNFVYSLQEGFNLLNIKETLRRRLAVADRRRIVDNDHVYLSANRWLDARSFAVLAYGHGEHDAKGFCACYTLNLDGVIDKCKDFRLPARADPEEYCDARSR